MTGSAPVTRRRFLIPALAAAAAAGWWLLAQGAPPPLPALIPAGPLLYLEARDLQGLLGEWNRSAAKREWLSSANYQALARSRAVLRLAEAQKEFAASGLTADLATLESLAGAESALAVYDLGNLELLFLTRLPAARAAAAPLWRARSGFTVRRAAGAEFFVKRGPGSSRTVAFAHAGEWFLASSREDLLAGALALIAGQSGAALASEGWFAEALSSAPSGARELRLAAPLDRLTRTPQFRSYWAPQNITELRQYRSVLADFERSGAVWTERRVLTRAAAIPERAANQREAAELAALADPGAGFTRAWASPDADAVRRLAAVLVSAPPRETAPRAAAAPGAPVLEPAAGGEDLEERIDTPRPGPLRDDDPAEPLVRLLQGNAPRAALVSGTPRFAGGVFVETDTAFAALGESPWNPDQVREAFAQAAARAWSLSSTAPAWREADGVRELEGLGRLAYGLRGRILIAGNRPDTVRAMLARPAAPPGDAITSRVVYRHAASLPLLERLARMIDQPFVPEEDAPAEPPFLSGNAGSIARLLRGVAEQRVEQRDDGLRQTHTVNYRFAP
jgi:hypothetical protein